MQKLRQDTGLRNLWLKDEQDRVIDCLRKEGLNFLIFKGIPLTERLYGSLAERPCADIDLLCRMEDFHAVVNALSDLGFNSIFADPISIQRLSEAGEGVELSSDSGATIDLHFGSTSYFEFAPLGDLRSNRLVTSKIGDLGLFCLLCDHGSKHMWHRIIWLLDLALLLRTSQELNPTKLSNHFRRHGYDKVLKFTLGLLADYTILPPEYLSELEVPVLKRQRSYVVSRHAKISNSPEILPRNLSLHLAIIEGLQGKISYILARTFHPNANDFTRKAGGVVLQRSYLGSRLINVVISRFVRFFGPIRRWLLFTNTTTSS